MLLIHPKLFITSYFNAFINQLDIRTLKIEQKNRDENCEQNIEMKDWRQSMINQLDKIKTELLCSIDGGLDFDMKQEVEAFIKMVTKKMDHKRDCISLEDFNELKQQVEGYSVQLKSLIMSNQCFIILSKKIAEIGNYHIDSKSSNLENQNKWMEIMPIIHIKGFFIDEKEEIQFK